MFSILIILTASPPSENCYIVTIWPHKTISNQYSIKHCNLFDLFSAWRTDILMLLNIEVLFKPNTALTLTNFINGILHKTHPLPVLCTNIQIFQYLNKRPTNIICIHIRGFSLIQIYSDIFLINSLTSEYIRIFVWTIFWHPNMFKYFFGPISCVFYHMLSTLDQFGQCITDLSLFF